MDIPLGEDVTAAGKIGIFTSDQRGRRSLPSLRILCPVDETREVAGIEVAKAMDLVHHFDPPVEQVFDAHCQLEVEIVTLGEEVKEQVSTRTGGASSAHFDRPERPQADGSLAWRDDVPEFRAETDGAVKLRSRIDSSDFFHERRDLSRRLGCCPAVHGRIADAQDKK